MKKLLYIPAIIFGLHSLLSAIAAGYYLWTGVHGSAALAIIFVFTGMIACTMMIALAQD